MYVFLMVFPLFWALLWALAMMKALLILGCSQQHQSMGKFNLPKEIIKVIIPAGCGPFPGKIGNCKLFTGKNNAILKQ